MSRIKPSESDRLLLQAFARLDPTALGTAVGVVCGVSVLAATLFLILKGGEPAGPRLQLLGQYFIGYTVSWSGSVIGLGYGLLLGFVLGWLTASLRNVLVGFYLRVARIRAELSSVHELIDDP